MLKATALFLFELKGYRAALLQSFTEQTHMLNHELAPLSEFLQYIKP